MQVYMRLMRPLPTKAHLVTQQKGCPTERSRDREKKKIPTPHRGSSLLSRGAAPYKEHRKEKKKVSSILEEGGELKPIKKITHLETAGQTEKVKAREGGRVKEGMLSLPEKKKVLHEEESRRKPRKVGGRKLTQTLKKENTFTGGKGDRRRTHTKGKKQSISSKRQGGG